MNLQELQEHWDLIVIGGGITGAGVFRESVRMGLQVLLLEQRDFAEGTSSRSSKLIHGGLRYLREGQLGLTRASVKEREYLLKEAGGLVEPLEFLLPIYQNHGPGKWTIEAGLSLYDLIAHKRQHHYFKKREFIELAPHLDRSGLVGGFRFVDAQVDDARLVLRLINDAMDAGGQALNYTAVNEILRDHRGHVAGVVARDTEAGTSRRFFARAVINATGTWAEKLHPSPIPNLHIRPLRGSHLILPFRSLPLSRAISLFHPRDNRGVFAAPWEGVVIFGTTDVDHGEDLSKEPSITREEVDYLLEGIRAFFPAMKITEDQCLATMAGVRPVLSRGNSAPSQESREHVVWVDNGMVTVTGGKLTTFRMLAWDTLKAARPYLPDVQIPNHDDPVFSPSPPPVENRFGLPETILHRVVGRYGDKAADLFNEALPEDLYLIPGTHILWAELPFLARREHVRHLTDLLLRRVRIGLLTPNGGLGYMDRIRRCCEPHFNWDTSRWNQEIERYREHWNHALAPPKPSA